MSYAKLIIIWYYLVRSLLFQTLLKLEAILFLGAHSTSLIIILRV